jgi:tetratricopeptide (TPR) repeat protein
LKKHRKPSNPDRQKKFAGPTRGASPPLVLSPGRTWVYRLFALVVLPLALLAGLEVILRLAGCGYTTGFFEKIHVGGTEYMVDNEDFSLRFFPPQLARWPGPVMFEAQKPANTYRIFILGESAARGEPEPNYAASRYLKALLEERFPQTHFEVINLGITAIDSHVILPLARDCHQAGGDLWIIYMGNNEMVGPFGAATVFGAKALPLAMVRLDLALQQSRVGQLIVNLSRQLHRSGEQADWGGMKMFLGNQLRADDPRREMVYRNFAANLDEIIHAGLGSGAKILLNTVAVNLADCPPFASLTNANFSSEQSTQFQSLFRAGCQDQGRGDWSNAAQQFAAAANLDPIYPEVAYRRAECLSQMGDAAAARDQYQKACDDDALPFRADSRINSIITAEGKRFAGAQLAFFDAASALAAQTTNGVCGKESFYEHVHFNLDGQFKLGREWAEQVERLLPPDFSARAMTNGWAGQNVCDDRLGLTDWNRCAVTEIMIDRLHRQPLSSQFNNAERLAALESEAKELQQRMNPTTAQTAAVVYVAAINRSPQDPVLHENYAEFLESAGDLKTAVTQWQQVGELLPHSCEPFYQVGRLLENLNQWNDAEAALNKAVALRPRFVEAWYELGNTGLGSANYEKALRDYQRASELDPLEGSYYAFMGKALAGLNRHAEAIQRYQQSLKIQPDSWEVHFALGDELAAISQFSQAADEYAEVVRLKPDNVIGHLDLGVMRARLGLFDDALLQFAETLRLDPNNRQAQEYIDRVHTWKNQQR